MPDSLETRRRRTIVARLYPGEDILQSLQRLVTQYDIRGGQLSLIGAVSQATLGYFDRERSQYHTFSLKEDLEVVSCVGNISRLEDDTVVVHAHMVTADRDGRCYGGHVMEGCTVSATIEVVITEFDRPLMRERDEVTGLNLLKLQ